MLGCFDRYVEVKGDGTDGLAFFQHGPDLILLVWCQLELSPELHAAFSGGDTSFFALYADNQAVTVGRYSSLFV